MRPQNIHAFFKGSVPNMKKYNTLVHAYSIHLVSGLHLRLIPDQLTDVPITLLLCHAHCRPHAFTLGLTLVQAGFVQRIHTV